jgi:hypothetical protein
MKSLLDLIKSLYGPKAISSTIGTRTNVIRLPSGKLQKYLSTDLNIEAASDNAAKNAYNEMKELIPDIAKLNDSERLIFEGNLRRLKNKLEASGILPKQTVAKEAEVLNMETKEPVTGESLKKLTEEQGTINPPTTVAGRLEQSAKRLEGLGKNLEQEFSKSKKRSASEILDEYFHSYRTMQSIEDEGLVRAVARQIMYADLNAGRLKVPKEVEDTIRGMTAKDVLDDFSQWYGAAALEDLFDNAQKFYRMESPQEAIKFLKKNTSSNWENVYQPREKPIKEYMEPEEFKKMMENATINRVGIIVPKGSEKLDNATAKEIYDFYLKTGDRKLVQEEMKSISEGTKFDSFATEDRNKILDILTDVLKKLGPPAVAGGVGLEYLAEKTTPQIEGGTQQSLGLDYLTGMETSEGYANGGRIGFQKGTIPKMLEFLIEKLSVEKGFNKGLLERAKPKAIQDLYVNQFGSLPTAEEIANIVNKELKGKKSMETVNPKTGEVTVSTEPVKTAEKQTKEFTDDEMIAYIKKYKEEGPTLEEFTKKINKETGSNFTPEQLKRVYGIKIAYPHSTPIIDNQGKYIGGALYNPPLDVSISDTETLTKSIVQTRKAKGLSVPKKYQEELKSAEVVETPETPPKAGEGRFTKQQVLEKIIQSTIQANPTDEYIQKTFPNFIKEIRAKPELANNENVWKTFTQDFPENKRLVVYGDDTVDFFTKGENLPEGMKQTVDLADTYGISMQEARRIKQMEPTDQVMEIKKLKVLKNKTQKGMSLHDEMNMVLNQYDKSMFIKNEQGIVDVTNPENIQKMALLLKKDHPELYKRLEMQTEPNILENFDITGRKPNASGGLNYLMGF